MEGSRADEIRVLGPIEIVGEQGAVALPALKERQLLAALLVDAGNTRSSDVLVDALWGGSPPRSAPKLLQVYVSKLRKVLPASAHIDTRGSGYALELEAGVLDSARFERLLMEGREAARAGNPALAASLLRRALALWRGQAYGDLAYEEFVRAEAERLEELHLAATEERIEAELELGRHVELLPELRSLAGVHPMRERLLAQAMLALYRAGRQSEALDLYGATRAHLHEELGLEPGAELRDVQRRILQHDPTLARASDVEHARGASLPVPPNPLLGREREVQELGHLLRRDEVRLLVLTGAGGSGKTRLALEATRESASSFANGAAFVGLASVQDPGLLVTAISTALGVEPLASDPLETVTAALRPREMLLLLDNAEHLREAASVFVELVSRAPRLTLLVTSRVVLHLSGEHVYPVDPLADEAAVALFLERAREADARFDPEAEAEHAIRSICERLDGLPLAIELAAGRIRTRTPEELLNGLDQRLPLLTGGPRDLPARQRTLRATLEWSVDLLDEHERRDIARLSVFAGGCTLEAAEAVCDTNLERLASLVDHNLVLRTVGPDGSRYSMLETIRDFAAELLDASGEADAVHRRHAEHMLRIAETLGLSVDELGTGVPQRHDVARAEQDNMRAALDWALEANPELGLRLAVALEQFWVTTNPREGRRRFAALLARAHDIPMELEARALRDLGGSTEVSGDWEGAAGDYKRSLELYETIGDEVGILHGRYRLANCFVYARKLDTARTLVEETLERARRGGFRFQESDLLEALSLIEFYEGDLEAAYDLQRKSLDLCREVGGWVWGETTKLAGLAEISARLGRRGDAEAYGREALEISRRIGDRRKTAFSLATLALAARTRGDPERAGRLWGAIEAEQERALVGGWAALREEYASRILVPSSAELERGLEVGRAMTLDEAATYALEEEEP